MPRYRLPLRSRERARLDRARTALDHQALGSNRPGSAEPAAAGYGVDVVATVARALMS